MREWRLRSKLTAVLVLPLILAGVLGTLRVTDLARSAQGFAELARQIGFVQQLDLVVHDLQGERRWMAAMLATGVPADRDALRTRVQIQVQRVDTAATRLVNSDFTAEPAGLIAAGSRPIVAEAHRAAVRRLSGLAALRRATFGPTVAPGKTTASSAIAAYSTLIAALLNIDRGLLDGALTPVVHQVEGAKALSVAKEQASQQQAVLLTGILSGGLSTTQQAALRTAEARFDASADEFGQAMSPAQRGLYFDSAAAVDRTRLLVAALDRAVHAAPLETVPADWNSASAGTIVAMRQGVDTLLNELRTDAQERSGQAWREALWDGAAVAALLLLAVLLLVVVVRSLLQPLRTLRTVAFEVADRRLPEAVEQVLSPEGSSASATVDPVPVHSREEVGQIARAFDEVHNQAVRLATEQAQLRSSLSDVFLTASGRSQVLLEQQLRLIEELRSTAHDPELASGLLQLDLLAARMCRHSENLLVLAGGPARRGAEGPLTLLEVLSNAVAEIDADQRVTVCLTGACVVAGPVSGELTHLIAELLDNAISVTPPDAMVTVSCALTEDKSLRLEITDSGPGLHPDELGAINARLVSAPVPASSAVGQLGLVVVRELAGRHGITVQLRQRLGARGIITAVLLPSALVTVEPKSEKPLSPGCAGAQGQLPLRVSVVGPATAPDLFSPSAMNLAAVSSASLEVVSSQLGRPLTAQEEWLELFGQHEPPSDPPSSQLDNAQAKLPVTADPLWSPMPPGGIVADGAPGEVREEIFEMVSAWFRGCQADCQSGPVSNPQSTIETEWRSPFDEGWRAAQALRTRVDHEVTPAGLPKRQPREHLVSGADVCVPPIPVPVGPARTPEAVRGRLARYQRGLRVGRHARVGPDEQLAWTDIPQPPLDR
ncbi:MAG: sensor histidine kinase [Pseudonocardiaceae bacterium]